jgi:hypothetical protein
MRLRAFLFVMMATALCHETAVAQQSVFESGNGDSSVFLSGKAGLISYNLGDSTARLGLVHDAGAANYFGHLAYGFGAGGTVDSNVANVLNKNATAPGGFVETAVEWKSLFAKPAGFGQVQSPKILNPKHDADKNGEPDPGTDPKNKIRCDDPPCGGPAAVSTYDPTQDPAHVYLPDLGLSTDGLIFQFHYGRTQFYLLPSAANPVATPTKTNFDQFRGTIAYNQLRHYNSADWTLGIAVVPGSSNNLSSLVQETYQAQTLTGTTGGQTVLSGKSETVYVGKYSQFLSIPINGDVVYQPKFFQYLLGFDAMVRSELGGGSTNRYFSPGFGAYFYKSGSPVVPLGGVTYSYKKGQSEIALVIGWTFGGTQSAKPKAPK